MRRTWPIPIRRLGALCGLAVLLVGAAPRTAPAQSVWELTPYRVGLLVAVDPEAGLGTRLARELPQGLLHRIETDIGAAWDARLLELTPQLRYRITRNIADFKPEDLDEKAPRCDRIALGEKALECDKIMFVSVGRGTKGFQVRVRELDGRTRRFGLTVTRSPGQAAKIRDAAFDALVEAFVPLARIAQSQGNSATLRLRAGGLPVRDDSIGRVRPGDLFRPLVRYNSREGKIRKIEEIQWTYLVVEEMDEQTLKCHAYSAFPNPLSGRRRGRVEPLALAVRPRGTTTRLLLRSRSDPNRELVGYDVYAGPPEMEKKKTKKRIGRTGAEGDLVVHAEGYPLRILDVKHGGGLLGRLPVVPGFLDEVTAPIRDDDLRMAAEAYTTGVQEELIDIVTRRRILIQRARRFLKAGKLDQAEEVVKEINALPMRTDKLRELRQQELKLATTDKFLTKQISKLFDKTRELVDKFLDRTPVENLLSDLNAAQRGKRGAKAPNKRPR